MNNAKIAALVSAILLPWTLMGHDATYYNHYTTPMRVCI
jgi:hypothetical protein